MPTNAQKRRAERLAAQKKSSSSSARRVGNTSQNAAEGRAKAEAAKKQASGATRVGNTGQRINRRQAKSNFDRANQISKQNFVARQEAAGFDPGQRQRDIAEGNIVASQAQFRNPDNAAQAQRSQAKNRQAAQDILSRDNSAPLKNTFSGQNNAPNGSTPRSRSGSTINREITSRREESKNRNDVTRNRQIGEVNEQAEAFRSEILIEAKTDEYKQRAYDSLGFKNDGTDFQNMAYPNIKRRFDAGGRASALKYINDKMSRKKGNAQAIEADRQRLMEELERVQDFTDITNGEYIFPADQEELDSLENEVGVLQEHKEQDSQEASQQAQEERQQGFEEFDSALATVDQEIENFNNLIASDPETAAIYTPLYNFLTSQRENLIAERAQLENAAFDSSGAISDLQGAQAGAFVDLQAQKRLAESAQKIRLDVAKAGRDFQNSQLEIKKINDSKAQSAKIAQNAREEQQNRRTAARFGLDTDTNGLKWMQDELAAGENELADMIQIADIQNTALASKISSEYSTAVDTALLQYEKSNADAHREYRNFSLQISNSINSLKKDDAEQEQARIKDFWSKINANDASFAKTLSEHNATLRQNRKDLQAQTRSDQQSAFTNFLAAANSQTASDPTIMAALVRRMAESGIDVNGIDVNGPSNAWAAKAAQAQRNTFGERAVANLHSAQSKASSTDEASTIRRIATKKLSNTQLEGISEDILEVVHLPNNSYQKQQAYVNAAEAMLEGDNKKSVLKAQATRDNYNEVLNQLSVIENTGYWKQFINNKKKFADIKNEDEILALDSMLVHFSSQEAKDIFGANFTETEQERAKKFLQIEGLKDNISDVKVRWETKLDIQENKVNSIIQGAIGHNKFTNELFKERTPMQILAGEGGSIQRGGAKGVIEYLNNGSNVNFGGAGEAPSMVAFDSLRQWQNNKRTFPKVGTVLSHPISDTKLKITGYKSDASSTGLDLAPLGGKGATFNSIYSGEIIEVVDDPRFNNDTNRPDSRYSLGTGNETFGKLLKIRDKNGYILQVGHLDKINVKVGDMVGPGQALASIGNTGTTIATKGGTGVHMDLQLFNPSGKKLDGQHAAAYINLDQI